MTLNYYLEQTYNEGESADERKEIQGKIQELKKAQKEVPLALLNPNETSIYLFMRIGKQTIKVKTGQRIYAKYWSTKPDKNGHHVKRTYNGHLEFNGWLSNLRTDIHKLYNKLTQGSVPVSFQEIKEAVLAYFEKKEPAVSVGFLEHLQSFIAVRSTELSKATLAKYKILYNHLDGFSNHQRYKLSFETVDMRFFDLFRTYLIQEKKHTDNTLWKDFATLKTFMAWAHDRGLHQNLAYKKFKSPQREAEMIYLTEPELMKLYNADLPAGSRLDKVRDVFCFGCFTGQRYSDIANLKRSDIRGDRWALRSVKTDTSHNVPLNGFALAILKKYEEELKPLPVLSNQKTNDYLKELGELLEIDDRTTITKKLGNSKVTETEPKYTFLSTHTARRTFITLSLEKGMRPEVVMRISGHTNYATFKKYIKISEKVTENEMNDIWQLPLMKVVS